MKTWTSSEPGNDRIITIRDQAIYKGNPKKDDFDKVIFELKSSNTIPSILAGIPYGYIKSIEQKENKNYIEILFGRDSLEHLRISNPETRREIFEYLKNDIPNAIYTRKKPSAVQSGKKPLIASVVVLVLFLWTLNIAMGIEAGNDYDVAGKQYRSVAGIVLVLASLGVTKVVIIFGSLLLIALLSFLSKIKNPVEIHRLTIQRQ